MTKFLCAVASIVLALPVATRADEPSPQGTADKKLTKATYLVTGLHCPPCTKTVETSLLNVKGIHAIRVDWKTKNARVEFDETVLPAQKLAQLIAATPHMMGGNMHYAGWLALKTPDLKDEAMGKQIQEVLRKTPGVRQVAAYPAQHLIGVSFDAKGAVTSRELIAALAKAGIKAENL